MAENITLSELKIVTEDGEEVSIGDILAANGINFGGNGFGLLAARPAASSVTASYLYFATDTGDVYRADEADNWDLVLNAGASGAPVGTASGDLTGTYPNPQIAAGAIVAADLAASLIDGAPGVSTTRMLGTTATAAAAGDDVRLSDSRAPSGAAGGALAGTYPNPTLPSYYTRTQIDAITALLATASSVLAQFASHVSSGDPHEQYLNEAALGVSVATLSGGRVPTSQLGTGTAGPTKVLTGDGSWQTVETLLTASPGTVTTSMLAFEITDLIEEAVSTHDTSLTAHDTRGFIGVFVANAADTAYVPLAGRKIVLRAAGKHDPAGELNDYDIVGDGS